ncbi:hypothetical protein L7F22_007057 [Adiantum nelumboides]|nr:hypothetical protein [Adiantum nelumboides]
MRARVGDSQSKQLAHEAAEVGDLISLEALRKKHVDIMALDGLGRTPLWYAEQSCHFKVVEYLKEQEELVGKRRAREKSKSKVRCSSSKGDPPSIKVKSTFEEVRSPDASQQELELPQMAAAEDPEMKLQVLQERNFHLTLSGMAEQSAKEASNTENFICDADRCMPCVVGQETEISGGSIKKGHDFMLLAPLPLTKEVSTSEAERKATRRKKNKAGKKSQASHKLSEQDIAVKSGLQSALAGPESLVDDRTHAGEQVLGAPNKESSNEALSHLLGGSEEIKMNMVTCEYLPNLPVLTTGERSLKCMATCESDNSKHVNKLLQEALVSGVVENLEAAIQTCMVPESGADDALLKKVRVALAKRLKRVEKSTQMERELAAAVNERSSRRLLAAIVAIEHVPRLAAAFAEKITEARSVLLEIQKEERFVKKDALENVVSDSDIEAASISLECGKETGHGAKDTLVVQARKVRESKGTESVLGPKKEHSEAQVKENRKGLLKIHTERQLSTTCKREDGDSERLLFQNDLVRNGCPKGRGEGKSFRGFSQPLLKLQDSSPFIELKHERVFPSAFLRSSGNTQFKEERPPLLPTPAYAVAPLPVDHATRSVIQPPRHKDHPALLLERIPITPQLFPISQGAPFGYSYREVLEGKADVSEGFTSLKDSASEFNELGPSHISQLFPPCSSHQLFSTNSDLYNPWSSGFPEQGASVFQPRPSLTNIESAHLAGDFVPSSTTLFSSAYGESDEFLNSIGFTASNFPGVLPSHHVHSPVHLRASECNGSSLPAFVQQALSCTCDDDDYEQVEPVNSSSSMNSSALCFPELKGSLDDAKQDQSFGSCLEPMFKKKASQLSFFNQDFQHLSQMHLQQSGILDTSLGVSCSVCLDNPKDATLISCGHQLCKGCAEQMHRLHHPCPVCNRMIETVLSLCS